MSSAFNQAIGTGVWPSSLRRVRIGGDFSQSLDALGSWMPFLEEFTLLVRDHSLLVGIVWPKKLKKLTLYEWDLHGVDIPPAVELATTCRDLEGSDY